MAGMVRVGGGDSVDINREVNGNNTRNTDSNGTPGDRVNVRFPGTPSLNKTLTMRNGETVKVTWG